MVQRIFDEYIHGKTLPQIIKGLNANGIRGAWGGNGYPTRITDILSNEKYIGDALCQKTYVIDHITHKKVKNDQTVIPSYYIRNHHEPLVSRKAFDMASEIRSMRDRHTGSTQYTCRRRITCPICGEKLERAVLQRANAPAVWHCRPERGNVDCAGYYIDEKYIDRALREAYRDLDMEAVKELVEQQGTETARAAAAAEALRMKEELPELERVEYYFGDAMVREIRVRAWDTIEIVWKCGLKSTADIRYDNLFDTPFSKEQMSTVTSKKWRRIATEAADVSVSGVQDTETTQRIVNAQVRSRGTEGRPEQETEAGILEDHKNRRFCKADTSCCRLLPGQHGQDGSAGEL